MYEKVVEREPLVDFQVIGRSSDRDLGTCHAPACEGLPVDNVFKRQQLVRRRAVVIGIVLGKEAVLSLQQRAKSLVRGHVMLVVGGQFSILRSK